MWSGCPNSLMTLWNLEKHSLQLNKMHPIFCSKSRVEKSGGIWGEEPNLSFLYPWGASVTPFPSITHTDIIHYMESLENFWRKYIKTINLCFVMVSSNSKAEGWKIKRCKVDTATRCKVSTVILNHFYHFLYVLMFKTALVNDSVD